jgi:hypothetical protein
VPEDGRHARASAVLNTRCECGPQSWRFGVLGVGQYAWLDAL